MSLEQKDNAMAHYLQEPSKNGATRLIATSVELDELSSAYPALWEHLSETAWESGAPRTTSTLTIFVEEGLVKLCLRDRAAGRTAWASGKSMVKAWMALEAALEDDSAEWRKDRPTRK